jgi:secreted PhoX family phosphatase
VSGSTINAGAYVRFGNNQMLCADPRTREVRQFLTGVRHARREGHVRRHPAPGRGAERVERPGQPQPVQLLAQRRRRWPARSSTLIITKDDGGEIGS